MNKSLALAVTLGMLSLAPILPDGSSGSAAAATPALMRPPPVLNAQRAPGIDYVRSDKWYYDRHRHGHRYKQRHGRYRYHHGGWWYSRPWWTLGPSITLGIGPGYDDDSAHVSWCLDHYRSYNPRTDRYLGYDGDYHRCNSPYG
ncbi:MAG: BA14K family protein [Parvibaculaceae bacterium]